MSTLRNIRKRLHSIQSVKQLTQAMEMIAASRLHYAQIRMKHTLLYLSKIKSAVDKLNLNLSEWHHPLLEQRKNGKIRLVVIGADMGLNGSYHHDVFTETDRFLKQYPVDQIELTLIGRKTVQQFKDKQWFVHDTIPSLREGLTPSQLKTLTDQLTDSFVHQQLGGVWFIYTHYINMFSRKVLTEKLLPIDKPTSIAPALGLNDIFEPTFAAVHAAALSRHCLAKVQAFFDEAHTSELAARIFAMKTATQNAEEMTEKLTLLRNKVRQGEITKEMLEITAGAEQRS